MMRTLLTVPLVAVALVGCGGGSSEPEVVPLYAGTYFVVMDKTVDDCNTGVARRIEVIQTVSQSGRAVTLVSNQLVLQGQVDPDDLGISTSAQTIQDGVRVTTGVVYRASNVPGLFGAGLSIVADAGNQRCVVAYNGQAQLQ
ncbi:hypothetical protein J2W49_004054 [Hydrogenophaga palleronii]|uniref:Lipoprotein n=1 Tax=Hydrogenophaga palleronii TaxID=65655 RepID=A0ABU1WRY8_9BURK|nr:hypothetical protein [Hydrogenophaga palleronii]MDR7152078.1 hypothetical protein [Hydrogenophaga palleronii]